MSTFLHDLRTLLLFLLRFLLGQKKEHNCGPCPPALRKPEPFLYSQSYLMSLGLPVTWDNPDIFLFDGSVLVDPHNLQASTPYTVLARIWNNSTEIPVMGLVVDFSYLSFGAGTESHVVGSAVTDLNVKGLPGCPAYASVIWTTPAALGHYCVQVLLKPPDDLNWLDNLGQRNTDVRQPASPAVFSFEVGHHVGPRPRRVHFTVDCYQIPPLPPCDDRGLSGKSGGQRQVDRTRPPVPEGWTVTITPERPTLAPGQELAITATIEPPDGFVGTQPFNVTAYDDVGPFGGVTLTVEVA